MTLTELKQERAALLDDNDDIFRKAENEKRDITKSESATVEKNLNKVRELNDSIEIKKEQLIREAGNDEGNWQPINNFKMNHNRPSRGTLISSTKWIDKAGNDIRVYSPNENISRGQPAVGIGQIARAMLTGARTEAEKRALVEGTDSAGGFTVPSHTLNDFFDKFRSKSRIIQSGARTIRLETDETTIAKVASDPTVSFEEESAESTPTDLTFQGATFKSRTLRFIVTASRELTMDSVNINSVLETVFAGATGAAVDAGILFGSNSGGQMKGLTTYDLAEVDMGDNGAELTNYDPLVQAYRKMLDNNSVAPTAYIMAPREWETLAVLKDDQSRYLDRPQALEGIPFLETTHIPTDEDHGTADNASRIVTGNWNDLVIGLRSEMRIELLREKYAEKYQYGFLCHMRLDALPAREESFAQITGIIPASS